MDPLGVLVERGCKVDVQSDGPQWSMVLQHPDMKRAICSLRDNIPAAICTAIMEIIEREGTSMYIPKPICHECAQPIAHKVAYTRRPVNAKCHKCGKSIFGDRVQVTE